MTDAAWLTVIAAGASQGYRPSETSRGNGGSSPMLPMSRPALDGETRTPVGPQLGKTSRLDPDPALQCGLLHPGALLRWGHY